MKGAAHHQDLRFDDPRDPPSVGEAKAAERIVAKVEEAAAMAAAAAMWSRARWPAESRAVRRRRSQARPGNASALAGGQSVEVKIGTAPATQSCLALA